VGSGRPLYETWISIHPNAVASLQLSGPLAELQNVDAPAAICVIIPPPLACAPPSSWGRSPCPGGELVCELCSSLSDESSPWSSAVVGLKLVSAEAAIGKPLVGSSSWPAAVGGDSAEAPPRSELGPLSTGTIPSVDSVRAKWPKAVAKPSNARGEVVPAQRNTGSKEMAPPMRLGPVQHVRT
jgi:hypothetical protein